MNEKKIYKITIFNDDLTTIRVIANNKVGAVCVYQKYIEENFSEGFIDEDQDFKIESDGIAYE